MDGGVRGRGTRLKERYGPQKHHLVSQRSPAVAAVQQRPLGRALRHRIMAHTRESPYPLWPWIDIRIALARDVCQLQLVASPTRMPLIRRKSLV
jgi:hypothetical protein